jgi:uncharacterized protein (DUF488 family)
MVQRRQRRTGNNGTLHPAGSSVQQLALPSPFSLADDGSQDARTSPAPIVVYTIGHSNLDAESFLALLAQHGLRAVLDVRSAPYSRYVPHFSRGALAALLDDARIRYVWAGDLLGGRPDDPACYGDDGSVDYAAIAGQDWYEQGVRLLLGHAAAAPTAILCSEEDPRRCHRHALIEPSLRARDAIVLHIRRDGSLETIAPTDGGAPPSAQLAFAGFAT